MMITRRKRQNVNVAEMKEHVNEMLKHSICSADNRQGMITILEEILHATKNYRGFRYLRENEVPAGELPGIRYPNNDAIHSFDDTDPTRVKYI